MKLKISLNRRIGYKKRIIIFLLLFGVVAAAIVGGFSFVSYRNQILDKSIENTKMTLDRGSYELGSRLFELKNYYLAYCSDDRVSVLISQNMENSDCDQLLDAANILKGNNIIDDYIDEFTIINFKTGKVLSNKGFYTFDEMLNSYEIEDLYDLYSVNGRVFWHYITNGTKVTYQQPSYRLTVNTDGLNLIMILPKNSVNISGMLIVNIDSTKLYELLDERILSDQKLAVFDNSGKMLYSTDEGFGEACSEADFKNDYVKLKTAPGISYVVGRSELANLGWTLYVGTDQSMINKTAKVYFFITIVILLAVLAAFLLLMFRIVYRPVSDLVNMVGDAGKAGDELEMVASHIERITNKNELLEDEIEHNKTEMLELIERKLLNGEVAPAEIYETASIYDLFQSLYYCTMNVVIHGNDQSAFAEQRREKSVLYDSYSYMKDRFADKLNFRPIYHRGALWVVFEGEDIEEIQSNALEFFNALSDIVKEKYQMIIYAGLSGAHTDAKEFLETIPECVRALNECQDSDDIEPSDASILNFYEEYTRNGESIYDRTFDKEIAECITSGDKERAYQICNDFSRYLKNPDLGRSDIMAYTVQFVSSMTLAFMEMGLNAENMYRLGANEIYSLLFELYDINKMRKFIKYNLIDSAWEKMENDRGSKQAAVLAGIDRLVAEHKGNITLTECSEELGVNPTYIWKLLKKERGKAFSEYQESYKLDEAKRLLLETDLSVAEIAAKLNYTNAQNFIRFFSKETGLTPGKFRKQG